MENDDEIVINLRDVFCCLKKNFTKVLTVTAMFVVAAGAYAFLWPATYESAALLKAGQAQKDYFTSRSVLIPIIEQFCEKDSKGRYPRYADFLKRINVVQPRNSQTMTITVQAKEPELARDICAKIVRDAISKYVEVNRKSVEAEKEQNDLLKVRLNAELAKAENNLLEIKTNRANAMQYDVAYSEISALRLRFGDVMKSDAELAAQLSNLQNDIQVIDMPEVDDVPVSPKKVRTLAIALVLGLICGSVYVVLKEQTGIVGGK